MTRKCVLCKETNYKNSYSFFSAPKDPEMRKKWQEAIAIDNYAVSDDTYVCSKHFAPSDIITHWVSGVPPHVVTIKYKKCRLRPGAIPSTSCESMNNLLNNHQDEYEEFEVNRGTGRSINRRPNILPETERESFLIPREDKIPEHSDGGVEDKETIEQEEMLITFKQEDTYCVENLVNDGFSEDTNNSIPMEHHEDDEQELHDTDITIEDQKFIFPENEGESQILYVESGNCDAIDCIEEEIEEDEEEEDEEEKQQEIVAKKARISNKNRFSKLHASTGEDDTWTDVWDSMSNDNAKLNDRKVYKSLKEESDSYYPTDNKVEAQDPLDIKNFNNYEESDENAMLFEDLLDIYTEVQLPRGWSSMVTSKGHATTVVYAYMGMTKNGMPYVEKQVFLKSDMKLRCGAANKELNPRMHNLVKGGRNTIVRALSDVEELVEEFNQRIVCEGCAGEKTRSEDIENFVAYRDVSAKWRHIECPIIVNNGTTRCSKCSTLDSSLTRSRVRRHNAEAHEFATALRKKEKTIRTLERLLRKINKRNKKFTTRDSIEGKFPSLVTEPKKIFMETLDNLDMPKIQRLMIKECLRACSSDNEKSKYSETWVFLSLLLYIESPRMYRYIMLNKYMILPSMRVIRRYLHQIKTDTQFYNLFQRTIEPFQPNERENEKEPT